MADHNELREKLHLACLAICDKEYSQALDHLKLVQRHIDGLPESTLAVEYALLYAWTLDKMADDGASDAYKEAEGMAVQLDEDQELQMLVHALYGRFLKRKKMFARARLQLVKTMNIAQCLGRSDIDCAVKLEVIELDLENQKDPLLKDLKNLGQASNGGDSYPSRLNVWCGHVDDLKKPVRHRLAARTEKGSISYFRKRLDAAKLNSNDSEDDEDE